MFLNNFMLKCSRLYFRYNEVFIRIYKNYIDRYGKILKMKNFFWLDNFVSIYLIFVK